MLPTSKPVYPSNPILRPTGVIWCPQCGREWDLRKGESPNCIECAAAWYAIENAPGFKGHGSGSGFNF